MPDKERMPAAGTNGVGTDVANEQQPPSAGRSDMDENAGQSGGGAYPNPHDGTENADTDGGFFGHGGQSNMRYYGGGEPEADSSGGQENAVTEDEE